ncbi:hypothetical protein HOLleu_16171 [Holothuria leucospilota]|uniref:Death domain-containing protein n=1 Tax=Holothuria leucospilota TaxID=206669 RepID=A0A9Q1C5S7_HOLLE|nr:hypothetical protein HOLleu_16171 [Holothuria leucospilota]
MRKVVHATAFNGLTEINYTGETVKMAANLQKYSQEESSREETEKKMSYKDIVEDDTLESLSKKFAGEWKVIGRNLGFKEADLDMIKMEQTQVSGSQQQIQYRMLLKWKEKNKKEGLATRAILAKALEKAERTDLAEELLNDNC